MNFRKTWQHVPEFSGRGNPIDRLSDSDIRRALEMYRAMGRTSMLSGPLTPSNTRTAIGQPGLIVEWAQSYSCAEEFCGRLYAPKRQVKQYILSQDSFRRIGKSTLMREPGTVPKEFKSRVESRTIKTQPYGLRTWVTGEDIREADAGLSDPLQIEINGLRNAMKLELEAQFVDFITTSTNYATGHSGNGTLWNAAAGDPISDLLNAKGAILQDAGTLTDGEWCLCMGYDVFVALQTNADITERWGNTNSRSNQPLPDAGFIASALGVQRICVCTMTAGPASVDATTMPVVTDNAFLWPSSNDTAALCYVNRGVSMSGRVTPGSLTACAIVTEYGYVEDRYIAGRERSGPEGDVEFGAVYDDWNITAIAVDSASSAKMVPAYLLQNLLTA